jgi:hypothetical protein
MQSGPSVPARFVSRLLKLEAFKPWERETSIAIQCLCVSCACSGVATCFVFRVWRRRVERSETGQFRIVPTVFPCSLGHRYRQGSSHVSSNSRRSNHGKGKPAINSRMCLCVSCACSGVATCFVFRVWRRRVERSETHHVRPLFCLALPLLFFCRWSPLFPGVQAHLLIALGDKLADVLVRVLRLLRGSDLFCFSCLAAAGSRRRGPHHVRPLFCLALPLLFFCRWSPLFPGVQAPCPAPAPG